MLHLAFGLWQQRRRLLLAALPLVLGVIYLLAGDHDRFTVYGSLQGLERAQAARGMVIVGRFGKPAWPALVVDRSDGMDGVRFTAPGGQSHQYRGFSGPMKALTLRSGFGGEATYIVVLATRPPKADPLQFPGRR